MIQRLHTKPPELLADFHGDTQIITRLYTEEGTYAYAAGDLYHHTKVVQLHITLVRWGAKALQELRKDMHQFLRDRAAEGYVKAFAVKEGVDIKWAKFVMLLGFPAPEVHMAACMDLDNEGMRTYIDLGGEDAELSSDSIHSDDVSEEKGPAGQGAG